MNYKIYVSFLNFKLVDNILFQGNIKCLYYRKLGQCILIKGKLVLYGRIQAIILTKGNGVYGSTSLVVIYMNKVNERTKEKVIPKTIKKIIVYKNYLLTWNIMVEEVGAHSKMESEIGFININGKGTS
jgi:hypothetical protein